MSAAGTALSSRRRLLVAAPVVLVLALLAWLGVRAFLARSAVTDARDAVQQARVALQDYRLDDAQRSLDAARKDTSRARGLTGDVVWRAAGTVPLIGNTFDTGHGLAASFDELTADVLPQAVSALKAIDPKALRGPGGRIDLTGLTAAKPGLEAAAVRTDQLRSQVQALPTSGVLGPLGSARRDLASELGQLSKAARAATDAIDIAPALVGADRPRRFLVLVQQTGETRGTGGLIGGYVELVVDKGKITAGRVGSNGDLRSQSRVKVPAGVPADYVKRYTDEGGFTLWQNINLSPDLPVVARVINARWQAEGGKPLDGVVMADANALSLLLAGSGPLKLASGQELMPEQLVDFFSFGQYIGAPVSNQINRKEQLSDVAKVVVSRLIGGEGDDLLLLRGVVTAIRSGHVHLASDDPKLAPILHSSGFDFALPDGPAPVAFPVVFNASGGKLDTWLDRSLRYEAGACKGKRRESTITTTLTNRPPPGLALPPYVTIRLIDGQLKSSTTGRVGLDIYGTRGATLLSAEIDGKRATSNDVAIGTEDGLPVWQILLDTPPETARTVVLKLNEPTAPGAARVPNQPIGRDLSKTVDVPVC